MLVTIRVWPRLKLIVNIFKNLHYSFWLGLSKAYHFEQFEILTIKLSLLLLFINQTID
jgi:hypothetical protein